MTPIQAQNTLQAHLQAMPNVPPIGYENGPIVTDLPRLVVLMPSVPQSTLAIDGQERGTAQIVVRIEVEDGKFAGQAEGIANNILAHFAAVQSIGRVKILTQPTIGGRYRSDGVYYLPVTIQGRFYT